MKASNYRVLSEREQDNLNIRLDLEAQARPHILRPRSEKVLRFANPPAYGVAHDAPQNCPCKGTHTKECRTLKEGLMHFPIHKKRTGLWP